MVGFTKFRPGFKRNATEQPDPSTAIEHVEREKRDPTDDVTVVNEDDESGSHLPDQDLQRGVQDVEAVTLTWSKRSLIIVFFKYVTMDPVCYARWS